MHQLLQDKQKMAHEKSNYCKSDLTSLRYTVARETTFVELREKEKKPDIGTDFFYTNSFLYIL